MRHNNAIMLRLPPDLLEWVEKQAKRKKVTRQVIIYDLITRSMILGEKTK